MSEVIARCKYCGRNYAYKAGTDDPEYCGRPECKALYDSDSFRTQKTYTGSIVEPIVFNTAKITPRKAKNVKEEVKNTINEEQPAKNKRQYKKTRSKRSNG